MQLATTTATKTRYYENIVTISIVYDRRCNCSIVLISIIRYCDNRYKVQCHTNLTISDRASISDSIYESVYIIVSDSVNVGIYDTVKRLWSLRRSSVNKDEKEGTFHSNCFLIVLINVLKMAFC